MGKNNPVPAFLRVVAKPEKWGGNVTKAGSRANHGCNMVSLLIRFFFSSQVQILSFSQGLEGFEKGLIYDFG
jgi:hypothetical protein